MNEGSAPDSGPVAAFRQGAADLASGRLPQAAQGFRRAADGFRALVAEGQLRFRDEAAQALNHLGATLAAAGSLEEALAEYQCALALNRDRTDTGDAEGLFDTACTLNNMAVVLADQGALADAAAHYEQALKVFGDLARSDARRYMPKVAGTVMNLGIVRDRQGQLDMAVRQFEAARDIYDDLIYDGQENLRFDWARALRNLGSALREQGNLEAAIDAHQQAASILRELLDDGQDEVRQELALALGSLGLTLKGQGVLPQALAHFDAALAILDDLGRDGRSQFEPFRANMLMNQGMALEALNQDAAARHSFERALSILQGLVAAGFAQFLPQLANATANAGLALVTEAPDAMLERLEEARVIYQRLVDQGDVRFLAEVARLQAVIGTFLSMLGRPVEALPRLQTAARIDHGLIDQGGPQYFRRAVDTQATLLGIACAEPWTASDVARPSLSSIVEELQWLDRLADVVPSLRLLEASGRLCAALSGDADPSRWPNSAVAPIAPIALRWMRLLLRDANPTWLTDARIQPRLLECVNALQRTCLHAGAANVAEWFLATQGLRAQRAALLGSDDPQVQRLEALWARLDQLSQVLLGWTEGAGDPGGRPGRGPAPSAAARAPGESDATQAEREKVIADHRETLFRARALQARLADAGKVPPRLDLDLTTVTAALREGRALWLLARGPHKSSDDDADTIWLVVLTSAAVPRVHALDVSIGDCAIHLAAAGRLALRRADGAGREGLREGPGPIRGMLGMTQATTLWRAEEQTLQRLLVTLRDRLLPLLFDLAAEGIERIDLVPSGELHTLPWAWALRPDGADTTPALHVFPSAGAWWLASAANGRVPERALRFAMARHDARDTDRPLPWVQVEARLSEMLWNDGLPHPHLVTLDAKRPAWPPADRTDEPEVQALLCIGHGAHDGNSLARAGLLFGGGVLAAPQLSDIRRVQCLLLSCCALGRIDDAMGEPLGLMAAAFGYGVRSAIGALVAVDDLAMLLFSLAFQWRLRHAAQATSDPASGWVALFLEVQADAASGRWPRGFADWLRAALPQALLADTAAAGAESGPAAALPPALWHGRLRAAAAELGCAVAGDTPPQWAASVQALADAAAASVPHSVCRMAPWLIALGE